MDGLQTCPPSAPSYTPPMPLPTHFHPADRYGTLARRCEEAAAGLPELPTFAEVLAGDRERWLAELGYTFWNRELLEALAARCRSEGPVRWVELAAGTGRWAAELARRGVTVAATDDHSQAAD